MTIIDLTTENFEERAIGAPAALVVFMTQHSESYAALAPDLQMLAELNPDVVFGIIDAEQQPKLAAAARISAIPTIVAFREGNLVFREKGALAMSALEQLVDTLRNLDMRQVAEQLAERAKQAEQSSGPQEVSVLELSQALERHALVIDVRTPLEYSAGHVPGAVLLPLHDLGRGAENLPKDARLYLICKSGDRSRQGAALLSGLGFETVNVSGGMLAWQEAGLPLEVDVTQP